MIFFREATMTNGWPEKIHPAFDGFESSKLLGGFSIQRFRLEQSFRSEKTKTPMRFSNVNRGNLRSSKRWLFDK